MPLAVVETIALEIESRLESMIGAVGYSTAVVEVHRPRRFAQFTPRNNQVVLVQGQTERVPILDRPGNPPAIAIRQTFEIHCHVMQDERDESTIDTLLNAFHADIVKAIAGGSSTWHTFDGNAIDAEWGAINYVQADGGLDGVQIPLLITYRVSEDDLTDLRN